MTVLFVSFTLIAIVTGSDVLPIQLIGELGGINDHHISCDHTFFGDSIHDLRTYKFESIDPVPNHEGVEGYMCIKHKHVLRCKEGFLGGQTLTRHSEVVPISPSECYDAVDKWKIGQLPDEDVIDPDCGWWTTNDRVKMLIKVIPKNVQFDMYNARAVDKIFLNGICDNLVCETVYKGVLWMTPNEMKKNCPTTRKSVVEIKVGFPYSLDNLVIHSNYVPNVSFRGACRLFRFCDTVGYRLRTGHFVKWFSPMSHEMNVTLFSLPICDYPNTVITDTQDVKLNDVELDVTQILYRDRCLSTSYKIQDNQTVSRYDISYFQPQVPVTAPGLIPINGSLRAGLFKYAEVSDIRIKCLNCDSCEISGKTLDGPVVLPSDVMHCNCSNFVGCDLPNGLRVYNTSIFNPLRDITNLIQEEIVRARLNLNYFEHPILSEGSQVELVGSSTEINSHKGTFSFSFGGMVKRLYVVLIFGLAFGFTVLVVYICIACRRRSHKRMTIRQSEEQGIPMVYWGR
uniref:Glycoprotein n=1 Tax=Hymenopteran rhabdo-related virus OKIAV8 TaxID=2746296 RepID=A0A7D7IUG6_9RHAB|nr:glycoprotein [Hymenopteran rhabdo-related virus OKIAV8]